MYNNYFINYASIFFEKYFLFNNNRNTNFIGLVPNLKILNIAYNPISIPPKDIIALGCSSILNYLRTEWNKLHPDEPAISVDRKNMSNLYNIIINFYLNELIIY